MAESTENLAIFSASALPSSSQLELYRTSADLAYNNLDLPDMIRDVLCKKSGHFGKSPLMRKYIEELVGDGLVTADGEDWAQRRRIVSPAFHAEKLKTMVGTIVSCPLYPAFGSSYEKGQKVFQLMHSVKQMMAKVRLLNLLPGGRWIPIPVNLQLRNLKEQLNSIVGNMVKESRSSVQHNDEYGNDLLGLMLKEAAVARYPMWQDLSRNEVQEVFNGTVPEVKTLGKLKTVIVDPRNLKAVSSSNFYRSALGRFKSTQASLGRFICNSSGGQKNSHCLTQRHASKGKAGFNRRNCKIISIGG